VRGISFRHPRTGCGCRLFLRTELWMGRFRHSFRSITWHRKTAKLTKLKKEKTEKKEYSKLLWIFFSLSFCSVVSFAVFLPGVRVQKLKAKTA
jgi:hypothetical protein